MKSNFIDWFSMMKHVWLIHLSFVNARVEARSDSITQNDTDWVTVRVGVEPEDTCLDSEMRTRLSHFHEGANLGHRDRRPSCRRHRELCNNWYCTVTEPEVYRAERSFKADGHTPLMPIPCSDVKNGGTVDG